MADGLVEVAEQGTGAKPVGRPALKYRAVARLAPSQMQHTETLVKLFLGDLADDPEGADRALNIGEKWGRSKAQETSVPTGASPLRREVRALSSLLGDMGFESEPPSNEVILVKSCPFLDDVQLEEVEEARRNGRPTLPPVCAVHLGVMKGALDQWDAETTVKELTPFSTVDRCRISLRQGADPSVLG